MGTTVGLLREILGVQTKARVGPFLSPAPGARQRGGVMTFRYSKAKHAFA